MNVDVYHYPGPESITLKDAVNIADCNYDAVFASERLVVGSHDLPSVEAHVNSVFGQEIAGKYFGESYEPEDDDQAGGPCDGEHKRALELEPETIPKATTYVAGESLGVPPQYGPFRPRGIAEDFLCTRSPHSRLRAMLAPETRLLYYTYDEGDANADVDVYLQEQEYNLSVGIYNLDIFSKDWALKYLDMLALGAYNEHKGYELLKQRLLGRLAATAIFEPDSRLAVIDYYGADVACARFRAKELQRSMAVPGTVVDVKKAIDGPIEQPKDAIRNRLISAMQVDGPEVLPKRVSEVDRSELRSHLVGYIITIFHDGKFPCVSAKFADVANSRIQQAVDDPCIVKHAIRAFDDAYRAVRFGDDLGLAREILQKELETIVPPVK